MKCTVCMPSAYKRALLVDSGKTFQKLLIQTPSFICYPQATNSFYHNKPNNVTQSSAIRRVTSIEQVTIIFYSPGKGSHSLKKHSAHLKGQTAMKLSPLITKPDNDRLHSKHPRIDALNLLHGIL